MNVVTKNSKVTIEYSLCRLGTNKRADDGKVFESTFVVGKEGVMPLIEDAVMGRRAGEVITLEIMGSDIFGPYDESKVIPIPMDRLDADESLKAGDFFHFRDAENRIHPFRVKKVENNMVWADFNHPLGDEKFLLNLLIKKVEQR